MKGLYDACSRLLDAGEDLVMAAIIHKDGSAPRTAGAKMIIRRSGLLIGTIGGGLLEARVLECAKEAFETSTPTVRTFNLTGEDAASTEMICGGRVEVLVDFLAADNTNTVHMFRTIASLLNSGQGVWLATELPLQRNETLSLQRYLLHKDGSSVEGTFHTDEEISSETNGVRRPRVNASAIPEEVRKVIGKRQIQVVQTSEKRYAVELINSLGTVYLFGAGHVGQQVAKLTSMVDFRTVVLDDRAEFANRDRFPTADEIRVMKSFNDLVTPSALSRDSYVVILTRGHAHDKIVLEQALMTDAGYIGLISSKRKRNLLYQALRDKGVPEAQLARVYSPIGVEISAETPEEIAISIVAQLIQVRGHGTHG